MTSLSDGSKKKTSYCIHWSYLESNARRRFLVYAYFKESAFENTNKNNEQVDCGCGLSDNDGVRFSSFRNSDVIKYTLVHYYWYSNQEDHY